MSQRSVCDNLWLSITVALFLLSGCGSDTVEEPPVVQDFDDDGQIGVQLRDVANPPYDMGEPDCVIGEWDNCCPPGAYAAIDRDCQGNCGDGFVTGDEICDIAIESGPGVCRGCEQRGCRSGYRVGGTDCRPECMYERRVRPADDDGCCPALGNANNDSDCEPECGNNELEDGEECDEGYQGGPTCTPDCTLRCGNGVLDEAEECDTAIDPGLPGSCVTSCDDSDVCTNARLVVDGCQTRCEFDPIPTVSGDGCCAAGTNPADDSDCPDTCENGVVEPWETCDPMAPEGCPSDCDDANGCTVDQLVMPDTCLAECRNPPITQVVDGDQCCLPGETTRTDSDCTPRFHCEETDTRIDATNGDPLSLQLVELASGDVMALWIEDASGGDFIVASRYDATLGWQTPSRVVTTSKNLRDLRAKGHSNGEVTAVWIEVGASGDKVVSTRLEAGSWSSPEVVRSSTFEISELQIALRSSNEVVAVWDEGYGFSDDIRYATWDANHGWGADERVVLGDERVYEVQLLVDGSDVLVFWREGPRSRQIRVARYNSSTWSPPTQLSQGVGYSLTAARTGSGGVHLAWTGSGTWSVRLDPGATSWSAPARVSSGADQVRLVGLQNDVLAVWIRESPRVMSGGEIQSARFDASVQSWTSSVQIRTFPDRATDLAIHPTSLGPVASWKENHRFGEDRYGARYSPTNSAWDPVVKVQASVEYITDFVLAEGDETVAAWIQGRNYDDAHATTCGLW